ncbi:MAG: hypothetical protein ACRDTD_15930 [Pseudonocardiaceae bacterium]
MVDGPAAGLLAVIDELAGLDAYHLLHAARAELLRQLGQPAERRPPTVVRGHRRDLGLPGLLHSYHSRTNSY